MTKLGTLLDQAKDVITGERQDSYGAPEDSFTLIAQLWGGYLGRVLTAREVADMMVLFKVARLKGQKPTRDTYLDIAGYAAIAADRLLVREQARATAVDAVRVANGMGGGSVAGHLLNGDRDLEVEP